MPYAIMRFEKRKGGPASAIEKHHERKKPRYASNPDVDTDRSHLNYHLVEPRHKYYAEIQSRIEQAQRKNPKLKVRRDSVKFIDTIVTATPDYLTQLPPEQVRRYFERALEFFSREVGAENIFSAVVHMDERNPHMHLCFVPLTKDHRLVLHILVHFVYLHHLGAVHLCFLEDTPVVGSGLNPTPATGGQ